MVFLLAFLFAALLSVRADDPEVTVTRLQNLPNRLFYFDDTPVSHVTTCVAHPLGYLDARSCHSRRSSL